MRTILFLLQFVEILIVQLPYHMRKHDGLALLLQKHYLIASIFEAGHHLGRPVRVAVSLGQDDTANLVLVMH